MVNTYRDAHFCYPIIDASRLSAILTEYKAPVNGDDVMVVVSLDFLEAALGKQHTVEVRDGALFIVKAAQ